VHAEADFYGAMDGASKFVKGDAIAAILITVVNLIGGMAIGLAQLGMSPGDAVSTYSLLTVGDGLVSQIPALLLSVATGLVVTRSAAESDMGSDIVKQITGNKNALQIAGFGAMALCLIPGLPKIPFLVVGGVMLLLSSRAGRAEPAAVEATDEVAELPAADHPEQLAEEIQVDPLGLELAADMIDLVDQAHGGDLLQRVKALRRKIAGDLGVVVPLVRTRDNLELPSRTYAIKLFDIEVARGEAPPGTILAIGDFLGSLPGEATKEPVFGLEAKWIPAELRAQAELSGATVVERSAVITTHLSQVVTTYAARLLGREDVRLLTDVVKRTHPNVVDELTPALLSLGEVQRVLQQLLDEGIAIRDLVRIYEALSLKAAQTKDVDALVDAARTALGPAVVAPYVAGGTVHVLSFDPVFEQRLLESLRHGEQGATLVLDPVTAQTIIGGLAQHLVQAENHNIRPVLVCAPQLRAAVRRLVRPAIDRLAVLAYPELSGTAQVRSVGVVGGERNSVLVGEQPAAAPAPVSSVAMGA